MKQYKPSKNFLLSTGLLLLTFFTMQGVVIPSIIQEESLAQVASSRQKKAENIYTIKPSEKSPGAFIFDYKFNTSKKIDGQTPFDASIEAFDETKAGGLLELGQIRDAWGYPVKENAFMKKAVSDKKQSKNIFGINKALAYDVNPDNNSIYNCRANSSVTGYFKAYFEDVELNNGVGYDDQTYGEGRREEACQVLQDISELIMLDDTTVTPDILFMADPDMPVGALAGATAYFGYYSIGPDNGSLHRHIISRQDPTPGVGNFDAFIMTGFNGLNWDVDSTLNSSTYDFYTVLYHEVLHTLGFRGLLPAVISSTNDAHDYNTFNAFSYKNTTLVNPFINAVNGLLQTPVGAPSPWFITNDVVYRGVKNSIGASPDGIRPVYSPNSWQQGSSLSHFDMNRAPNQTYVMHPSIGTNTERDVHAHEKEVLCHLGYQVTGVSGCEEVTPWAEGDIVFSNGTATVCINPLQNDDGFGNTLYMQTLNTIVTQPSDTITYYSFAGCSGSVLPSSVGARSFNFIPGTYADVRVLSYTNKYQTPNSRVSLPASISIMTCNTNSNEYVCNGNFERVGASVQWYPDGWNSAFLPSPVSSIWNMNSLKIPFWSSEEGTPDIVRRNPPTWPDISIPTYNQSTIPVFGIIDSSFIGKRMSVHHYYESLITKLKQPLVPGQVYTLSYDAYVDSSFSSMYSNQDLTSPSNIVFGLTNDYSPTQAFSMPSIDQRVGDNNLTLGTWHHVERNFVPDTEYEFLELFGCNNYRLYYVDNVSVTLSSAAPSSVIPFDGPLCQVQPPATIKGYVYNDINSDGNHDINEQYLSGTEVSLYSQTGALLQTVVSQDIPNLGAYEFTNLPSGTYNTAFTDESVYPVITEPATNNLMSGYSHARQTSVSNGQVSENNNFGVLLDTSHSIFSSPLIDIKVDKILIDSSLSFFDRYITWRIVIQNLGIMNATNVLIKEIIPPGLIYHSNTTPSPNVYDSSVHILSIPQLSAGGQTYIDITMKVPNSPKVCGVKMNMAVLHQLDQTDTNPNNNQDTASITLPNCPITEAPQVK